MINSFDINAILNSKIEELKNAEPTAKKVNALFKSLTDSIEYYECKTGEFKFIPLDISPYECTIATLILTL